jgi:glucosamine 6-phosphate synthetase-like amidotransferase/phosphosugar isomerase protein
MNQDNQQTTTLNWEDRTNEPYYMGDSIKAIPDCIEACLDDSLLQNIRNGMQKVNPRRIFLIGCGTSYNACESIAYACRKALKIPADVFDALDFDLDTPFGVDSQSLVISISHTGQTLATCLASEKAQSLGAFTVGISSNPNSRLTKNASFGLADPYPHETRPRGKTRSYHSSTLLGMLAAIMTASPEVTRDEFVIQGKKVAQAIRQNLRQWEKESRSIAAQWAKVTTHYMVAGFGVQKPNADEIALKIVEVFGEGATNYNLEEFAHGPGASFRKDMGIILFQTDPRTLERCVEIARGVAASEAQLVVITDAARAAWPAKAKIITLPLIENGAVFGLFPAAAAAQNLLYFLAIEKGLNPDVNCLNIHPELAGVSAIFFPPGTH